MSAANMLTRANLQPRLVHLIAGLRVHQVEEAVALLLDYVDAGTTATPAPASTPPAPWQPQFDSMSVEQEALALQFAEEIAGKRGENGSPPDPVRLLEMAAALYEAELKDAEK